jgi:hypothetical protein
MQTSAIVLLIASMAASSVALFVHHEPVADFHSEVRTIYHEPIVSHEPIVQRRVVNEPVVEQRLVHQPILQHRIVHQPVLQHRVVYQTGLQQRVVHRQKFEDRVFYRPVEYRAVSKVGTVQKSPGLLGFLHL